MLNNFFNPWFTVLRYAMNIFLVFDRLLILDSLLSDVQRILLG
jgi:hypothetical protein